MSDRDEASSRRRALRDFFMIVVLAGGLLAVIETLDLSNRFITWLHVYEGGRLASLFPLSLYFVIALAVFAWRRYKDLHVQIQKRRVVEEDNARLIPRLADALSDVSKLRKLLPMCSTCKKIRDGNGSWSPMESYLETHLHARLDGGICPECAKRYYYSGTAPQHEGGALT